MILEVPERETCPQKYDSSLGSSSSKIHSSLTQIDSGSSSSKRHSLSITQALISVYDSPDFFLSHSPSVPIYVQFDQWQKQLGLPPSQEMKRFVAEVIAAKLSDKEISGLKQMFKMIDTDNSGYISFEELKDGLNSFGANLEESEIHDLMQAVMLMDI